MKLYHFILVFVILVIMTIIVCDIKTDEFKTVVKNRSQIDQNLKTAIDDGITMLVQVDDNNNLTVNKEAAMESFFMSLDSSFGVLSDVEQREKLNLYIPVAVVTMNDGYYVFYNDEYTGTDGMTYFTKHWSDKFPFYYEDEDFVYGFTLGDDITIYDKNGLLDATRVQTVFQMDYHEMVEKEEYTLFRNERPNSFLLSDEKFELIRKGTIVKCIEETMAYYISQHNHIAEQYGITYNFSLPMVKEQDLAPYLDDISMFIVFQGYPYGGEVGETYNRFNSAGAKVSKRRKYYVEQKGWYLIYHRENCPDLLKSGIILREEPFYDIESCVKEGCYACPYCFKQNGVHAPGIILPGG